VAYDVANINAKALVDFGKWRTEKLGRKAHHSTINTHNTALNRVLDEAEQRGWITHAIRPKPINDGIKTESRGSFTKEEYKMIYEALRTFHKRLTIPILRPHVKCWQLRAGSCQHRHAAWH
jgi:integrase